VTEGVKSFDAAALVRLRQARGLSHDALGERVGRARPNMIAWEKGPAKPSPSKFVALARALEVEPWELTTVGPGTAELADLRAWAGLTQQELADKAGMTRSTYSLLERGGVPLRSDVAERIAAAVGCQVVDVERAAARTRPVPADSGTRVDAPGAAPGADRSG
jgi:transcriptional regulator with XRE-family HTH domain